MTNTPITSIEESRYPLPIPFGWFVVSYSDVLRKNTAKPLRYFGKNLVLFRNGKGEIGLLDAFCPHMGAHLGYDSQVDEEGLICPFHAWKWSTAGRCLDIPYSKRIPAGVQKDNAIEAYQTIERNGAIYAWYHPLGEAPLWDVVERPEINDPSWTKKQYRSDWVVASHLQEQAENSVDRAHFKYVHGTMDIPDSSFKVDGIKRYSKITSRMKTSKGIIMGTIAVEAIGPGCSSTRFSGICETLLFVHGTPIDDTHTHLRFAFIQEGGQDKSMGGVHKAIVEEICKQVEEDIPIWNSKRFYHKPILCDGDGQFYAFRDYYSQFYLLPPESKDTMEQRCQKWYEFWEKGEKGYLKKHAPARHYQDGLVKTPKLPTKETPKIKSLPKTKSSPETKDSLPNVGEHKRFAPGWYGVARENAFGEEEVLATCAFGRDLVLFKTSKGYVAADAYCPHLGAHLGKKPPKRKSRNVRLRVENDAIVCPFHAWRWDGKGRCVGIPYAKKIPVALKKEGTLPVFSVKSLDGILYVAHHPDSTQALPFQEKSLSGKRFFWDVSLDVSYEQWQQRFTDKMHYHWLAKVEHYSQQESGVMQIPFKTASQVILATVRRGDGIFEIAFYDLPFEKKKIHKDKHPIAILRQSVTPINAKQTTIRGIFSYEQGSEDMLSSVEMYLKREYTLLMCREVADSVSLVSF